MNEPRPEQPAKPEQPASEASSRDQATVEVLKLAADYPLDRPVDLVIRRLEREDGERWFAEFLRHGPPAAFQDPARALVAGAARLEHLVAMKNRAKALLAQGKDSDPYLHGILGYFLASACALLHYGSQISSSRRQDLAPMLQDLAAVVPGEYSQLFAKAAFSPQ